MKKIRFIFRTVVYVLAVITGLSAAAQNIQPLTTRPNLAIVATSLSSMQGGGFGLNALNDGLAPVTLGNGRGGGGNNRIQTRQNIWVQYEWLQPVSTKEIALFWWDFNKNIRLPEVYRIQYWNGSAFVPVQNLMGLGKQNNQLNTTSFDEIKTTKIRLELDSAERGFSTLLEWVVFKTDNFL